MKIRNDFVSNSSSSSFICSPEDACYIDLFNQSKILNLHEYLDKFGKRDIFSDWWFYFHSNKSDMKFVDDDEFSRRFEHSIFGILPKSAKKAYCSADVNLSDMSWSAIEKLWNAVKLNVESALVKEWGNSKFEYYEAEDCTLYVSNDSNDDSNDDDYYDGNEESYLSKWFDKHKMKFSRLFSNH